MNDDKKYKQKKPEEIIIKVSLLEASMILKLRKYDYGDFGVTKMAGNPTRVIYKGSEMLKASDGLELAISNLKDV
jgi:hypothetical protein